MISPVVKKFFEIADRWPQNIAVESKSSHITYAELKHMVV